MLERFPWIFASKMVEQFDLDLLKISLPARNDDRVWLKLIDFSKSGSLIPPADSTFYRRKRYSGRLLVAAPTTLSPTPRASIVSKEPLSNTTTFQDSLAPRFDRHYCLLSLMPFQLAYCFSLYLPDWCCCYFHMLLNQMMLESRYLLLIFHLFSPNVSFRNKDRICGLQSHKSVCPFRIIHPIHLFIISWVVPCVNNCPSFIATISSA